MSHHESPKWRTFREHFDVTPIERQSFDLSTKPWRSNRSLEDQLRLTPPEGEGFLMRATTEDLRGALFDITESWEGAQMVRDVADYIKKVHKKHMRDDGETPYEHHLLRVSIRAAQLSIANSDMIAVALLHDAPEDHDVTFAKMRRSLRGKSWYSTEKVASLFNGANALNSNKLQPEAYFTRIRDEHNIQPHLHLWAIKGIDRVDNVRGDLSFAIRHGNPRFFAEAQLLKDVTKKIPPVLEQVARFEPRSGVVEMMNRTSELAEKKLTEHNLRPGRARRRPRRR